MITTTSYTSSQKSAMCESCTLADAMRDCAGCEFDQHADAPRATIEDVFRMYRILWGKDTPDDFDVFRQCVPLELLDNTQTARTE